MLAAGIDMIRKANRPGWRGPPHLLSTMDYTHRERHSEAIYRFKDGMLPSDFFTAT